MVPARTVRIEDWTAIQELVQMSIGTNKGTWWADPDFGSELWILRQEGKVNNRTAGKVQQLIMDCLKWLKDDGIVSNITCFTQQTGKNEITYSVTIVRPNGDQMLIKDIWNAVQ